ncbi:cellulose binding domain-containing protein [Nonomuraea jabiensis]|uniref:cellulose binding domain-containing protein n=1 Tax=Nonomuraea jabiensis TaxID=882448 RepID=UPI00343280B1
MRFLRRSSGIVIAGLLLATLPAGTAQADAPPGYACAVTYASTGWGTGFTADVTISNTGTRTFSPWILQFVFPGGQTFTTGWNATWSATPPSVQATGPSFHKSIDPGTSFGVGFNASGSNDQPTGFTLNGVPCTVS